MGYRFSTILIIFVLLFSFATGNLFAKKITTKKDYPVSVLIDDYENAYKTRISQNNNPVVHTEGTVLGTSDFDYATAYYGRSIAVGPDGTIHIVWCRPGDPSNEVLYVRSTDQGKTFSSPVEVHDGYYGYKPSIAAHPTDPNIVIVAYVGYQNEGEIRSIRMSKSTDGGLTWGASIPVYGSAANCNNPDPIIDKDGNVYVAFDSYSDNFIRFNLSLDGGETYLPEPELVNLGQDAGTFSANISLDMNGNVHVLYGADGGENSWGDKNVYWNWRNMSLGIWSEVPPVQVSDTGTGTPYPSMVFDSNNVGHAVYDAAGTSSQREVQYRTLTDGNWSDPQIFPSDTDGGSTFAPGLGIDQYDNLYLVYVDAHQSGTDLTNFWGDIFTGTNIGGDWQVINFTNTGTVLGYRHPNVAYSIVDSLMHVVYTGGSAAPYTIEHIVGYPWPPEPTCGVTGLSDTYNTTGPFTVTAKTGDIDGEVTGATLYVMKNGEQIHEIPMTMIEKDSYEASFEVDGQPGDVISYYGVAIDNDGNTGESLPAEFKILAPSQPKADILIVYDDVQNDTFYTHILDQLNYVYEVWNVADHGGIDESVTGYGWSTIMVFGWVCDIIPTRGYEGDPFAAFLQAGTDDAPKNLFLASQDYFYANGEDAEPEFNAGDFAYDFFQIGAGINDPDQDTEGDTLLIGVADDPISGSFADEPIELDHNLAAAMWGSSGNPNWIDYTEATGEGLDIFFAANQGYGSGVSYDAGTFKTVMLPWMMSMLLDSLQIGEEWTGTPSQEAVTLMQNVLNWFNTSVGEYTPVGVVKRSNGIAKDYTLAQNYPNPFNPETSIRFTLPRADRVELAIFNSLGQKIRTLISERLSAGAHVAVWDGTNDAGEKVGSGVYFYSIKAGNFSKTMKMIMVK